MKSVFFQIKSFQFYFFILFFGFFVLTGCRQDNQNNKKDDLKEIKLAVFQLYTSGVVIAADRSSDIDPNIHCFTEAGLKPVIIKRSKGPEIVDALSSQSAEIGTLAITPQALQAVQGNKLVNLTTIQTTHKDIKVIGRKSTGTTLGKSLKGKKIGYVGGTFGEIFLSRYLIKYGLKKTDVKLVSAGPAQLRDLFISKSLDAIILWEPFVQDILNDQGIDKQDISVDVDRTLYNARMNLVARPEVFKNKRDELKKLTKAMICGERLIQKYPDKAQVIIERWLDRKPGTLKNVFDPKTFKVELNLPALATDLKKESEWAKTSVVKEKGNIPTDFSPFVDSNVMDSVAPDRVKH
jgi:sulfonate transport system substrate-binding protein